MSILKEEYNTRNTYGNDDPVCPHCAHKQTDVWYEISKREDGHQEDFTCQNCEKVFSIVLNITPTFTTNCLNVDHQMITDGEYKRVGSEQRRYGHCRSCEYSDWCTDEQAKIFASFEVVETFDI